jgi:hypothetical protein
VFPVGEESQKASLLDHWSVKVVKRCEVLVASASRRALVYAGVMYRGGCNVMLAYACRWPGSGCVGSWAFAIRTSLRRVTVVLKAQRARSRGWSCCGLKRLRGQIGNTEHMFIRRQDAIWAKADRCIATLESETDREWLKPC